MRITKLEERATNLEERATNLEKRTTNLEDGTTSAGKATKLANARTINGTSFDGSSNITTQKWGEGRNITIDSITKFVDGSDNINFQTINFYRTEIQESGTYVFDECKKVGQKCYNLELSFCDFPEQVGYELKLWV